MSGNHHDYRQTLLEDLAVHRAQHGPKAIQQKVHTSKAAESPSAPVQHRLNRSEPIVILEPRPPDLPKPQSVYRSRAFYHHALQSQQLRDNAEDKSVERLCSEVPFPENMMEAYRNRDREFRIQAGLPPARSSEREAYSKLCEELHRRSGSLNSIAFESNRANPLQGLSMLCENEQKFYDDVFKKVIETESSRCRESGQVLEKIRESYRDMFLAIPHYVGKLHENSGHIDSVLAQLEHQTELNRELEARLSQLESDQNVMQLDKDFWELEKKKILEDQAEFQNNFLQLRNFWESERNRYEQDVKQFKSALQNRPALDTNTVLISDHMESLISSVIDIIDSAPDFDEFAPPEEENHNSSNIASVAASPEPEKLNLEQSHFSSRLDIMTGLDPELILETSDGNPPGTSPRSDDDGALLSQNIEASTIQDSATKRLSDESVEASVITVDCELERSSDQTVPKQSSTSSPSDIHTDASRLAGRPEDILPQDQIHVPADPVFQSQSFDRIAELDLPPDIKSTDFGDNSNVMIPDVSTLDLDSAMPKVALDVPPDSESEFKSASSQSFERELTAAENVDQALHSETIEMAPRSEISTPSPSMPLNFTKPFNASNNEKMSRPPLLDKIRFKSIQKDRVYDLNLLDKIAGGSLTSRLQSPSRLSEWSHPEWNTSIPNSRRTSSRPEPSPKVEGPRPRPKLTCRPILRSNLENLLKEAQRRHNTNCLTEQNLLRLINFILDSCFAATVAKKEKQRGQPCAVELKLYTIGLMKEQHGLDDIVLTKWGEMMNSIKKYRAGNLFVDLFGDLMEADSELHVHVVLRIRQLLVKSRTGVSIVMQDQHYICQDRANDVISSLFSDFVASTAFKITTDLVSQACFPWAHIIHKFGSLDAAKKAQILAPRLNLTMMDLINPHDKRFSCHECGIDVNRFIPLAYQGIRRAEVEYERDQWARRAFQAIDHNSDHFISFDQFARVFSTHTIPRFSDRQLRAIFDRSISQTSMQQMSLNRFRQVCSQLKHVMFVNIDASYQDDDHLHSTLERIIEKWNRLDPAYNKFIELMCNTESGFDICQRLSYSRLMFEAALIYGRSSENIIQKYRAMLGIIAESQPDHTLFPSNTTLIRDIDRLEQMVDLRLKALMGPGSAIRV